MNKSISEQAIEWVKDYFNKNGNKNTKAIIGISGGKDSATVAALCCAALGKERVIGIMMPNGVQSDIDYSKKVCSFLGIKNYTINIKDAYFRISNAISNQIGIEKFNSKYTTNTPSRLRMVTLYGIAALDGNARVSCNGNLSELLAGYFTLWGDGAGDFAPLVNLYVDEVIQLGIELGLPEEICYKTPSDGMSGKTDEQNLGFTYDELKSVSIGKIENLSCEKVKIIKDRIEKFGFKSNLLNIPSFKPKNN